MRFLRTTSTRRLIAGCALVVALVVAGVVVAGASGSGGSPPPPKPLHAAVHDAIAAPKPTGVTARVHFTNNLVASGALSVGSPLLAGADGRLWIGDGRLRLELQSDAGDAQISFADGRTARSTTLPATPCTAPTSHRRRARTRAATACPASRRSRPPSRNSPSRHPSRAPSRRLGRPARLQRLHHSQARRGSLGPRGGCLGRGEWHPAARRRHGSGRQLARARSRSHGYQLRQHRRRPFAITPPASARSYTSARPHTRARQPRAARRSKV